MSLNVILSKKGKELLSNPKLARKVMDAIIKDSDKLFENGSIKVDNVTISPAFYPKSKNKIK
jgi:hypothetical protein